MFRVSSYAAILLGSVAPLVAQVPLVEYTFNETGATVRDHGPGRHTGTLKDAALESDDLHGPSGSGLTGDFHDRAFDNSASSGMGSGGSGGQLACGNINPAGTLSSFTLQGWYYVPSTTIMGGNARLIDKWSGSDWGFALRTINANTLTLTVNKIDTVSAISTIYGLRNQWVFFAVTYDANRVVDNITFYAGTKTAKVAKINSATNTTIGPAVLNSIPLVIGNTTGITPAATRPWKGMIDNVRIYGAEGHGEAALNLAQLEALRAQDCATPPAPVPVAEFLFNETGFTAFNTGTDLIDAPMRKAGSVDLHTGDKTGVSGSTGDRAFDTAAPLMGSANTSTSGIGRARQTANSSAIDTLHQFTITGWYRTSLPLANAARIIDNNSGHNNGGFLLRAMTGEDVGGLVLTVNNDSATSASNLYPSNDTWVFFAVSYDGTSSENNVRFYRGTSAETAILVDTKSLAQGAVVPTAAMLTLGNTATATAMDRPFSGRLDNLRIFAAALDTNEIDYFRTIDVSPSIATPSRPLLEYTFTNASSTCASTGTLTTAVTLSNSEGTEEIPVGENLRGASGDLSFKNNIPPAGVARHAVDLAAVDNLRSVTLSGWFYSSPFTSAEARVFDKYDDVSGLGYRLSVLSGRLTLKVNGGSVTSSVATPSGGWTFFAVTYDGTQTVDNVRFYAGNYFNRAALVSTGTLAQGTTGDSAARFSIGNGSTGYATPLLAFIDNMRLHGSTVNADGALAGAQIETLRIKDVFDETPQPFDLQISNYTATYLPADTHAISAVISGQGTGFTANSTLHDFDGAVIWSSGNIAVQTGSAGTFRQTIQPADIPGVGYYQLTTVLKNAAGVEISPALKRGIAVIPDGTTAFNTPNNIFGGMVTPHVAYPFVERERDAFFMKRIGMKWVHTYRLNWIHVERNEPVSGVHQYDWSGVDNDLNLYPKVGLKIIATTGWPVPLWASSAKDYKGYRQPTYFAMAESQRANATSFYELLSSRAAGKVAYYEIGNETDAYFWMGHLSSFKTSNTQAIIRDYVDTFDLVTTALTKHDDVAKFAPNATSAAPEGHLHKPWLPTLLDLRTEGKLPHMDALSVHYDANIDAIQNVYRQKTGADMPGFIETEIGGFWRGPTTPNVDLAFDVGMKAMIKGDYHQFVNQMAHKPKALCKFILREQSTYAGEGSIIAGLLDVDFNVRPSYVAFATLVRALAGATYETPLNITFDVNQPAATVEGHAFESPSLERINVLFLHGISDAAEITLRSSSAAPLTVIDVMGRETTLPVAPSSGNTYVASYTMTGSLPLIIKGPLIGLPGPVAARPSLVPQNISFTVVNGGFENPTLTNWNAVGAAPRPALTLDDEIKDKDEQSLRLSHPPATNPADSTYTEYGGASQTFNIGANHALRTLQPDEYFVLNLHSRVKGEAIDGLGVGAVVTIRQPDNQPVGGGDNGIFGYNDTFDWRDMNYEMTFDSWPATGVKFTLEFLLCFSTGTAWVDEITLSGTIYKRDSASLSVPQVTLTAIDAEAGGTTLNQGMLRITRSSASPQPLVVRFAPDVNTPAVTLPATVVIPANATSVDVPVTAQLGALETGDQTFIAALVPDSTYRLGTPAQASLLLKRRDAFAQWAAANLTSSEQSDPQINAPLASISHDGVANLLRAALGLSRHQPFVAPSPHVDDARLALTYRQLSGGYGTPGIDYTAGRIRYTVEVTEDLAGASWQAGADVVEATGPATPDGDGWETITIRMKKALGEDPKAFMRLRVTQP